MYNAAYTVASLLILIFLSLHHRRNAGSATVGFSLFPVLVIYAFVLAAFDIVCVVTANDPDVPTAWVSVCVTAYTVLEMCMPLLFVAYLPQALGGFTLSELRRFRVLFAPAAILVLLIIFVNPRNGFLFSIDDAHRYLIGPQGYLLELCSGFYLLVASAIVIDNRRSVERHRLLSMMLMIVIAILGTFAQIVFWHYRLVVFTYTFIILEMYMSFQIPEKHYDSLTQLLNREAFERTAQRMLRKTRGRTYTLICTNISEFKAINALHGREKGDEVLSALAHILRSSLGMDSVVGRLRADQFSFCIPTDELDMEKLLADTSADRMRDLFDFSVHVVFGIYRIADPSMPVSRMCDLARLALDEITDTRLCRTAYYDESRGEAFLVAHRITESLDQSIERRYFEVYLQPIIALEDGSIAAAEALVRWNNPDLGFLRPDTFIPLFERNGLISKVDAFVWEETCIHLRNQLTDGLPAVPVSVNLSRADLEPGLGDRIIALVAKHDLPPEMIRFEITETIYSECLEQVKALTDQLHEHGFEIMLDDFGSGLSSLSMLQSTRFDYVKFDRLFLADITTDERKRTVTELMIELCKRLGMPVIAEGIETAEQSALLRELGATYTQGYYFSRPLPPSDYDALLGKMAVRD